MLTINMLGKGAIYYEDQCISEKLSSKLMALVFLLVLNRNRNMSKEKIISYLWPDSDDEAAKSNLRFNLWTIKKTIPQSEDGEDFILSGKDCCRINERYPYICDITLLNNTKVSQAQSIEDLMKLKELFQGDFLEGLYLRNCGEFNEMILFERVVCQNRQADILEKLIEMYEARGRYEEELQVLNEVAAIEPYNEQVARRAVMIYKKIGNRTAAINYYKNFEIVLRRNLDISPGSELKMLYKELLEPSISAPPTPSDSGLPKPSGTGLPKPSGTGLPEPSGTGLPEPTDEKRIVKKRLVLEVSGLQSVEYYGAASIIDQIVSNAERMLILEMDPAFLSDLSFIYSGLIQNTEGCSPGRQDLQNTEGCSPGRQYLQNTEGCSPGLQDLQNTEGCSPGRQYRESSVPPVRIALAFQKLIKQISLHYEVHIKVTDLESMDSFSRDLILHLEKMRLLTLVF